MGAFTNVAKGTMLLATGITHAALFNGDPSGAGTEITGGTPAYARVAVTLASPSSGQIVITADAVFNVPASATVNYVAYYNALTAGTLLAYDDVTAETFASQGTYTLDTQTFSI